MNKTRKIAELAKKLAESEEKVKVGEFWHSAYKGKQLEYDIIYEELRKAYDKNEELKQQLAEKNAEHELLIDDFEKETENLKKQIKQERDARKRFAEAVKELIQELAYKEQEIEDLRFMERNIFPLVEDLGEKVHQEKIDFAIKQLEFIKTQCEFTISFADDEQEKRLFDIINRQIEEIKKGVK